MEVLTPQIIWKGYDASILPLGTTVLTDKKTDSMRTITAYFNGSTTTDGVVRVFVRCVLPASNEKLPAVIYMGDVNKPVTDLDPSYYTDLGYAVIMPDFAGVREESPHYTLYPKSMTYANFTPDCLTTAPDDLRFNCWMIWAEIAMRAITFASSLDEIDGERIALIGEGISESTVVKAAAIDKRIKCAITKFSSGLTAAETIDLRLNVALLNSSYAPMIKKPLLVMLASNEQDGSADEMSESFSLIPKESGSRLSISERLSHCTGYKQRNNEELWLDYYLRGEGEIPETPKIAAVGRDHEFYYDITAPNCDDVELFVSQGSKNGAIRHWERVKPTKLDEGKFTARVDAFDIKKPVYAFVNACTKGGMSVSSPIFEKIPALLGVRQLPHYSTHVIYDAEMGVGNWIAYAPKARPRSVTLLKGPFGIKGVSSDVGALATYKFSAEGVHGNDSELLQLLLYSTKEQTVTFTVLACTEEDGEEKYDEYSYSTVINPWDNWSKLTLQAADFKSPYAACEGWSGVARLIVESEAPVAIASMIWV